MYAQFLNQGPPALFQISGRLYLPDHAPHNLLLLVVLRPASQRLPLRMGHVEPRSSSGTDQTQRLSSKSKFRVRSRLLAIEFYIPMAIDPCAPFLSQTRNSALTSCPTADLRTMAPASRKLRPKRGATSAAHSPWRELYRHNQMPAGGFPSPPAFFPSPLPSRICIFKK